jgi:uncharacterized protein with HEPN domain
MAEAALLRWIETIGEAANHVDPDVQAAHPEVPWRDVVGLRNRVVHSYFEVDLDILWNVATVEVPKLVPQVEAILSELPDGAP